MSFVELLGFVAATLTTVAFLPQVVQTWRTRSAGDLSAAWLATFSAGVLCWLTYGVLLESRPVILGNGVTLVLTGTLIYFKWRY